MSLRFSRGELLNGHISLTGEPNKAFTTPSLLHSERGHERKQRGQLTVVCTLGKTGGKNETVDFTSQF